MSASSPCKQSAEHRETGEERTLVEHLDWIIRKPNAPYQAPGSARILGLKRAIRKRKPFRISDCGRQSRGFLAGLAFQFLFRHGRLDRFRSVGAGVDTNGNVRPETRADLESNARIVEETTGECRGVAREEPVYTTRVLGTMREDKGSRALPRGACCASGFAD